MTAKDKITKAKVQLILENPFFATLSLGMQYIEDPTVETAETDGTKIWYNPAFIDGLGVPEVKGVIAHECLHPGFLHHTRRGARDPEKWNISTDAAINPILLDGGFVLPPGVIDGSPFKGLSAEEIYNKLPNNPGGKKGNKPGQGQGNGHAPDPGRCGAVKDAPAKTKQEMHAIEAKAKQRIAQAKAVAKRQGKLSAGLERLIDEILQPRVNWKEILSAFLTEVARNDYTWRKPNPRYLHADLYLPALESIEIGDFVMIVDTSASVDKRLLAQFGNEMQAILSEMQKGFLIVWVDAGFCGTQEVEPDEPLHLEPKGGGGTDFRPGFDYIQAQGLTPSCVVYFTDGECDRFPKMQDFPVLWAVYGNKEFTAPFGEVIPVQYQDNDY